MKIISWNVNGIRSVIKKGFHDFLSKQSPDILCIQETKAPKEGIRLDIAGHEEYWNNAIKPGYSGTLILSKTKPISVTPHIGIEKHDQEGRVLTAEYPDFYLVNVYVPNSKRGLERLPYREKEWDVDFLEYLQRLETIKPVIVCGDFNVAHHEIDLTHPKANERTHGFTSEERSGFDNLINAGFIDTFREFTSDGGHYTWWSPMGQCRAKNIGWRIDYFLLSPKLRPRLKSSQILPEIIGSDHCPLQIILTA
jgi:exodeoxyribonuclease III